MIEAYTNRRIYEDGDIGLKDDHVSWHKIKIWGYNGKNKVRAVTEKATPVVLSVRHIFKDKLGSPIRAKDLRSLERVNT